MVLPPVPTESQRIWVTLPLPPSHETTQRKQPIHLWDEKWLCKKPDARPWTTGHPLYDRSQTLARLLNQLLKYQYFSASTLHDAVKHCVLQ